MDAANHLEGRVVSRLDAFEPGLVAADYVTAALGPAGAHLALLALRAGWLTPAEAEQLEPLARGLAQILDEPVPTHRGKP